MDIIICSISLFAFVALVTWFSPKISSTLNQPEPCPASVSVGCCDCGTQFPVTPSASAHTFLCRSCEFQGIANLSRASRAKAAATKTGESPARRDDLIASIIALKATASWTLEKPLST